MTIYKAPLRDMRFVLNELHAGEGLFGLPGLADIGSDVVDQVLDQAARLCEEVLAPLNRSGDEEGCRFDAGVVRTPAGFKQAYELYRAGGWSSLACHPEHGGQGLPYAVQILFEEMLCAANLSFTSYPGVSHGAYVALRTHASAALKETYLPRLVDGTWTGTMCLTEPQCGTDLSLIRTRAVPESDGSYALTGTKIFITGGEHDLTDNILHLVLARLPDAPPGIKGISLFLVPKVLPDGGRNRVACGAIEHKMGIKGSATCLMNFDGATGWLVGERDKGMRAMFSMMNSARLSVAMQGVGLAEASYQRAVTYAFEREQGRAPARAPSAGKADPIIRHPDVKRMLLTQRAYVEGMRALAAWIGIALDRRERHPDPAQRQDADDFVALMTPVAKALCTDLGFECTNLGVQVFGGHGFIREHGMEQYVRDSRIGQLYEGTNGVQAQDLVGRKLADDGGRRLRTFFAPVESFLAAHRDEPQLADMCRDLGHAFALLQEATRNIRDNADEAAVAAVATDYLRLFGLVALGFQWARMAALAVGRDEPFYRAKLATAAFFMSKPLTQCDALARSLRAGGRSVTAFGDDLFGDSQ